jgi:hypothetical protein
MRLNQQSMLADLNWPRVRLFLTRIWQAARVVLPSV